MPSSKNTSNAVNTFKERFNGLMERYGVRQSAIATRLDVSQAAVSGWANGKIPVRRTAKALAAIFGVRADWLLHGKGDPLPPGQAEPVIADLPIKQVFTPRLSERSHPAPIVVGLDAIALRQLAVKLEEASTALGSCAKIIARSAGQNRPAKTKKPRNR